MGAAAGRERKRSPGTRGAIKFDSRFTVWGAGERAGWGRERESARCASKDADRGCYKEWQCSVAESTAMEERPLPKKS